MKPIIVINLKTYKQGQQAINLARKIEKVDKNIIIGVQASDIYEIRKATNLIIYSQHVDYQKEGRATGFILPEAVKKDGASGSFLNHSEHKLSFSVLKKTIERCRQIGLKTLVFASSIKEAKKIEKLKPDFLVYEPPELVSGLLSVSEAKPEIIKKISKQLKTSFLVGAGIHTKKDIETIMEKTGKSKNKVTLALEKNQGDIAKTILELSK